MRKLLMLMAFSITCQANEAICLAEIIHAEDRASIDGAIQVANASINRATNQNKPICKITGVQRKRLHPTTKPYLVSIAQAALQSPRINKADSWDSGRKPHLPGKVHAYAGGQTFYEVKK